MSQINQDDSQTECPNAPVPRLLCLEVEIPYLDLDGGMSTRSQSRESNSPINVPLKSSKFFKTLVPKPEPLKRLTPNHVSILQHMQNAVHHQTMVTSKA